MGPGTGSKEQIELENTGFGSGTESDPEFEHNSDFPEDSKSEFDDDSDDLHFDLATEERCGEGSGGEEAQLDSKEINLQYILGAEEHLRGSWGAGSERTERRRREEKRILKEEGAKCYDIRALWERGKLIGVCKDATGSGSSVANNTEAETVFFGASDRIPSIEEVPRGCSPPKTSHTAERRIAGEALSYLLRHKTSIKEKYGELGLSGAYLLRHQMVLQFINAQLRRENAARWRREVALQIANCHGRGMHTARKLIGWERDWVAKRIIERGRQGGGDGRIITWFEDEGVLIAAREYIAEVGESKLLILSFLVIGSFIIILTEVNLKMEEIKERKKTNNAIEITSRGLARAVASYLVSTTVDADDEGQSSQMPILDGSESSQNNRANICLTSESAMNPIQLQETNEQQSGELLPEEIGIDSSSTGLIPSQFETDILNMVESAIQKTGIEDEQEVGKAYHQKRKGIRARTARRWLRKLGFSWEEVRKGVYVDGHERPDVIRDRAQFLNQLENLQPYLVEFDSDSNIKAKTYPRSCVLGGCDPPIILITHDESTLSSNEGRSRV